MLVKENKTEANGIISRRVATVPNLSEPGGKVVSRAEDMRGTNGWTSRGHRRPPRQAHQSPVQPKLQGIMRTTYAVYGPWWSFNHWALLDFDQPLSWKYYTEDEYKVQP